MKQFLVRFSPLAEDDLHEIWSYVFQQASLNRADRLIERLREECGTLSVLPLRGTPRLAQDLGVRTVGAIKGRATVVYRVTTDSVEILRVRYAGADHGFH